MAIKDNRKEMGFTQQELAGYLGLHRMQLTLCERSQRSLPYKASVKWSRMKRCVQDTEAVGREAAALLAQQQGKVPQVLAAQVGRYSRKRPMVQRKLQDMQQQHAHCMRVLAMVALLRQQPGMVPGSAEDVWLNSVEARTKKTGRACSPARQALLTLKLQVLAFMEQQVAAVQP